jgi:hypothetical protein
VLAGVYAARDQIGLLPMWPGPPQVLRGFLSAILLPVVVFLITRYVGTQIHRRCDGRQWPGFEVVAYTPGPGRHSSAVEQLFRKQQVLGSNPSVGSTPKSRPGSQL